MSEVMEFLAKRRNNAVYTNPSVLQGRVADIHITERGSNWLWAVFSLFGLGTIVLLFLSFKRPFSHRVFFFILTLVFFITTLDYYALASNLGFAPIPVEFQRSRHTVSGDVRQIWYSRYIDWFTTWPLLITALLLTARAGWHRIMFAVVMTWIMVVSWLAGALTPTRYKWGWYTFGVIALFVISFLLLMPGRKHAGALGSHIGKTYTSATALFVFIWMMYPIAWGVSEGGNVIAPDSEMVFYGILDLVMKMGVTALLLNGHRNIEPEHLGLHFHDHHNTGSAASRVTKNGHNGHTSAVV